MKIKCLTALFNKKMNMEKYMDFIDDAKISAADKAFKEGKYNLSTFFYRQALYKIRQYQGDKTAVVMMGASLADRLKKSEEHFYKTPMMEPILKSEWKMTKSTFVKGKQCEKYFFLDKFKRYEKTPPSKAKLNIFKKGRDFESMVQEANFPEAINISKELKGGIKYYPSYTSYLLRENKQITLLEAGLIYKEILILVDVLKKNEDGTFDVYEIKLMPKLNKVIEWDLGIQYYILHRLYKGKINSFNVVLRNLDGTPNIIDLKDKLHPQLEQIRNDIRTFRYIMKDQIEPNIPMGKQCTDPYECEFFNYCKKSSK